MTKIEDIKQQFTNEQKQPLPLDEIYNSADIIDCVASLFRGGDDGILLTQDDNELKVRSTSLGLFGGNQKVWVDSLTNIKDFPNMDIDGNPATAINYFGDRVVLRLNEKLRRIDSEIRSMKISSKFNTSHGVIYVTAKDPIVCASIVHVIQNITNEVELTTTIRRKHGRLECISRGHIETFSDVDEIASYLGVIGARIALVQEVSESESIGIASKLSAYGFLVICPIIASSSVHLLTRLLKSSVSSFSSSFLGIIGGVDVPTYESSLMEPNLFCDDELYYYYKTLDASPSPNGEIVNVKDLSASNPHLLSSEFLCDFIDKPHNPHVLMSESLTVLDIYATLRIGKWESCLDKSMALIKSQETGLDVINYIIGKY